MFSHFVRERALAGSPAGRRMRGASTVMRWLVLGAGLVLSWSSPAYAQGDQAGKSFDPKNVKVHIEHGIQLPWGKPGFRIRVNGWIPNGATSVQAVGPGGEKVDLAPLENPLRVDADGDMTMDVDYERKGLRQGHWIFLLGGKAGAHIIRTDLPRVEPPTGARQSWRLHFDAADPAKK